MIKLEKDENIVIEVRKHPFVFIVHTLVSLFFALAPLLAFILIRFATDFTITPKNYWLLLCGYGLWVLVMWVIYFIQWTDYYLDVWYITDKKIYDVLQKGFFHRQISVLRFDAIQDVTVEIKGVIPTLFDFGTIHVQTAGETSVDFTLTDARSPHKIKTVISDLLSKAKQK